MLCVYVLDVGVAGAIKIKRRIILAEMDKEGLKEVWYFYSDLKMQVGVCWEGKEYQPKEWR